MAAANHAVIRRAYRAFADRDVDELRQLSIPEIEIGTVTGILTHQPGPYRGHEGIGEYLRDVGEVWDELELIPAEFHDLDDERVLVLGRVRARRGSTLLDTPNAWLWRMRGGKVVAVQVYREPDAALELLGER